MTERPDWSVEEEENAREVSRSIESCCNVLTRPNEHPWEVIVLANETLKMCHQNLANIALRTKDPEELRVLETIALGLYQYKNVNPPPIPVLTSYSLKEILKVTHTES